MRLTSTFLPCHSFSHTNLKSPCAEQANLLRCINTNNLWNTTDDTEYVGVGQQSVSVGKELVGSREILQNAIDCALAVAEPGDDCGPRHPIRMAGGDGQGMERSGRPPQ